MSKVVYEIVEHDGGFAYRVGDVFSETFPTYQAAHAAAERAAQRQQVAGQDEQIQYQDAQGNWHEEFAAGDRRPEAEVDDSPPDEGEADEGFDRPLEEDVVADSDRDPVHPNRSRPD